MSKADQEKNMRMAARMKQDKIIRRTGRCPICSNMVSLPLDRHITVCKG